MLEDGVYADVRFEGEPPPPLRELAPGHVIYVDSLSKIVGGGLRIGWIAARGPVLERLAMLKMDTDFHTPTLSQHIAARYLARARTRATSRRRRRSTASAATRCWRRSSATCRASTRRTSPTRRPPRVGHADAAAGRARALLARRCATA